MRKSAKAKLQTASGVSLVELLLTVLILLLMTQVVADGMPSVIRAYRRAVDAANAETYLSTTVIALRSKLSLASKVDGTANTYRDPELGYYTITNGEKGIMIEYLNINMESRGERYQHPLLVGADDFIASYDVNGIDYNPDKHFFTITGLQVRKEGETEPLAKLDTCIIHTVNP